MALDDLHANGFYLQPMRVEHIPAVGEIERLSFTQPWPAHAYRKEINDNRKAFYEVARKTEGVASAAPREEERVFVAQPSLLEWLSRLVKPREPISPELEAELRSIVGYAGLWLMADEAHVTTIATHPNYRGRGVGELLLLGLFDYALQVKAKWLTLEVRMSNEIAQALYRKYTFKEMGIRKAYYSDDKEDALVMWTDPLDSPIFLEVLETNRARLLGRLESNV